MRIYIFRSETRKELRAFAGDPAAASSRRSMVPGPLLGLSHQREPPYKFSRDVIQEAIDAEGFQLWRLGKKAKAPVRAA
jgi:hypothetical protein